MFFNYSVHNAGTAGVLNVRLAYTYDAVNNRIEVTDTINGQLKGTEFFTYNALNPAKLASSLADVSLAQCAAQAPRMSMTVGSTKK